MFRDILCSRWWLIKKQKLLLGLLIPQLFTSTIVQAGNPALENNEEEERASKTEQLIFQDVHRQLSDLLPRAAQAYQDTHLHTQINTDFSKEDYPSEVDNENMKDGMMGDRIILSAVKKPMTEPAKIELSELLRYYYFNFTDATIYQPLSKQAALDYEQEKAADDALGIDRNLNYFDYLTLIETIYQTPTYTPEVRSEKLVEVEEELMASILALYGMGDNNLKLDAWGPNKSVRIPFENKKYSYLQLLAAYQRDESVLQTLNLYSALIDALYSLYNYSQALRQGLVDINHGFDTTPYEERIQSAYLPLEQGLVQDVKNILVRDNLATKAIMDGEQWQQSQLGNLGVTEEVRN